MHIEKIEVDEIEAISKEILSLSATIKILQRKVELLKESMEENEKLYKNKKITSHFYNSNKKNLQKSIKEDVRSTNFFIKAAIDDLNKIMKIVQSVKMSS